MKAFITGITGFAGSHLAEFLLDCGDQVQGSSATGRWRADAPERLSSQVPLFRWQLMAAPPPDTMHALQRFAPDAVYHLAALSVPSDCGTNDPTPEAWAVNVEGTRHLLAALSTLPHRRRLLLVSSCHVYGPVSAASPRVGETSPLAPQSAYGKTKLAAEQAVQAAIRSHGLQAVIARAFKQAGPRLHPGLMLSEWAIQLVSPSREPLHVLNLDSHMEITDVRDSVRAYRALIEHGHVGGVYNVGSGNSLCSGTIFHRMRELAGCQRPVIEQSPGRRQEPIADIRRLQQRTGWHPQTPLKATLRDTLQYWKSRWDRGRNPGSDDER